MKKLIAPDIIEQVALVTGQILHGGTGKPVIGTLQITVEGFPIIDKVLDNGTFVLSGRSELLFPEISLRDYQLNLVITATSSQFRQGSVKQSLTVTIPQGWSFDQPISKTVPTATSPILVLLPADSVFIRGSVFDVDHPGVGIPNVAVTVKQGSNTFTTLTSADADSRGRYSFQDASHPTQPQAFTITANNPASITCSVTGFKSPPARPLLIDFGRSLHEEYFYLFPDPPH